jgi:hypothetical protein
VEHKSHIRDTHPAQTGPARDMFPAGVSGDRCSYDLSSHQRLLVLEEPVEVAGEVAFE